MVKCSIRIASFLAVLFAIILVFKYSTAMQQNEPFGTNESFELSFLSTAVDKKQIIIELNTLVDQYNAVFLKVVPSKDDHEHQKDVVWFGSNQPASRNPQIHDGNISWLEPSTSGKIIHSTEMGARPLYGTYAMRGDESFRAAFIKWSSENDIRISFVQKVSPIKTLLGALMSLGIGNAVLISLILLFTTIIAWFVVHGKARALRLLGGASLQRIHIEDTATIIGLAIPGIVFGSLAFALYLGVRSGIEQLMLMLLPTALTSVTIVFILALLSFLLSVFVQPKAKHISAREIPLKRLRLLGRFCLTLTCVIAMLIVPMTIVMSSAYLAISNDYALWESMKGAVRVSYNDVDGLYGDEWLPLIESFFEQMSKKDNLCVSLAIDRAILLEPNEMGQYDHIVLTDRAWLSEASRESSENGTENLIPIEFDDIHGELKDFLIAQLPLWTRSGEVTPEGMTFYEFSGESFLALPPSVGSGGGTIQAKNPLIILVDNSVEVMNCKGFLLPLSSSGNVVFKNEDNLREVLEKSPVLEKISSIDSFAETALGYARVFQREALYCIAACVLCLISMGAAGIMGAQLWIEENKKRLFTLRTAGNSYRMILNSVLQKETMIAICATISGGLLASLMTEWKMILYAAVILLPLYLMLNYVGYALLSRQEFMKMCFRRES